MRRPTNIEFGVAAGSLTGGLVLGFLLGSHLGSDREQVVPYYMGVVTNTENSEGKPIGVRTYGSPHIADRRGSRVEGAHVPVVCVEPDGRELIDPDVPSTDSRIKGNDWYRITPFGVEPEAVEWINRSYINVGVGATAVPECAKIEGLELPN